jgi:tetratricopeptide (TPR) repeat protein
MRWRVHLTVVLAWVLTVPLSLAHAEQTLQQRYLDIYLKINDAEHLEKQGDYRGALDDFKDCYAKLSSIHEEDPNWESALVVHRMEDCKAKILELEPEAAAQAPPATNAPEPVPTLPSPVPPEEEAAPTSDEVASLKLELQAVKQELQITKQSLRDSQEQLETYRTQLETVNAQLAALKNQQSVDDRMGKLLSDNKALTDKLAAAEQEVEAFKTNPKSKLAMAQAQLKNLQDQYDASQEANKALQDTTTTLKQQLDQANADLVAANQKLATAGPGSPEYETLKRENEIMRDILTRELQEQAHRDMAKRLAQEEFDNLKLKSKVLQEQLDILGSPMTPPTNDQERELLASLKVPGPDVTQPAGNGFVANVSGNPASADQGTTNPPSTPDPSVSDTNAASTAPPATNIALVTPPATNNVTETTPSAPAMDSTTNPPPVTIVMNNQTPGSGDVPAPSATNTTPDTSTTNAPSSVTPPTAPASPSDSATPPSTPVQTNVADPNAPIPPTTPPTTTNTVTTPTPSAPPPSEPTTTKLPDATTTYTDTTINNGGNAPQQNDPTEYSTKARLPDDMRETAQDAADLFKNQKYDESAAKYQSIIDKYPESLYAWSNLGVVRFQQGKYDDALKALQQAVKLSPTDAFSYSNLGIVYYQLQQYENAIDALNSAKALDPNDAKTHNYLGCACSQKGWQEVAEKEFRKAIEIDPNFGDAHFNLALVYATSKPPSLELARREYNRALELGIAKDARLEKLLQGPQP